MSAGQPASGLSSPPPADRGGAELLMIRSEPPCSRCRQTEALLRDLAAAPPAQGRVSVRVIRNDDPEAAQYGAVLTPMTLLNGKLVCAGMVPRKAGLERLLAAELGEQASHLV